MDAKTSLSAGAVVRSMLLGSEYIQKTVTKIFPIVEREAKLPYIVYRRDGFEQRANKPSTGADAVLMEISVYARDYATGIAIAEEVRRVMDNRRCESCGLMVRSCTLYDAREGYSDDAMIQQLYFNIKL